MTIRSYTGIDVINVYVSQVGSVVGSTVNRHAQSASAGAGTNDTAQYVAFFKLDFTVFPAIPLNASISKIRCFVDNHQVADINGPDASNSSEAIGQLAQIELPGGTYLQLDSLNTSINSVLVGGNIVDKRLEWIVNYIPAITRDQLMSEFGFLGGVYPISGRLLYTNIAAVTYVATGGVANADSSFSNWTFEVTYTSGPFSWYLQTHTSTIGGRPAIIVDDIVEVPEGDAPPADSTFYGTSANFPDGIPTYDWYDPVSFTIINQPISPGSGWLLQLVDFIGDSTGDLQFDMALESIVVLMTDPSGIYTLVEGQRHDTLYERFVGVPSIDVKIPDPFAKTGYIP